MKQSEERVRGRAPASFGRSAEPEPEDFTVVGGTAIHVVVHAQVVPEAESLAALHEAIRATTCSAVLEGYADAFAQIGEAGADEQQPGGGVNGGTPPG